MPALEVLGRKFLTASDTLPITCFLGSIFYLIWAALLSLGFFAVRVEDECPEGRDYKVYIGGLALCFAAASLLEGIIVYEGLKGTILEPSKRRRVPHLILWLTLPLAGQLAFNTLCSVLLFRDEPECVSSRVGAYKPQSILRAAVLSTWVVLAIAIIHFLSIFDLSSSLGTSQMWERRFKWLALCCCFPHKTRSQSEDGQTPLSQIALLFHDFFKHLDLVPTDFAAGLYLLSLKQQFDRDRGLHDLMSDAANGADQQTAIAHHQEVDGGEARPAGVQLTMSRKAVARAAHRGGAESAQVLERVRKAVAEVLAGAPATRQQVAEAAHWCKYALAVYGHVMHAYARPLDTVGCALCRSQGCCACCCSDLNRSPPQGGLLRRRINLRKRMDQEAVLRISGRRRKEVVHMNYTGAFGGTVPYCIILDRKRKAVVLSVRGTFSVRDTITDLLVEPVPLSWGALHRSASACAAPSPVAPPPPVPPPPHRGERRPAFGSSKSAPSPLRMASDGLRLRQPSNAPPAPAVAPRTPNASQPLPTRPLSEPTLPLPPAPSASPIGEVGSSDTSSSSPQDRSRDDEASLPQGWVHTGVLTTAQAILRDLRQHGKLHKLLGLPLDPSGRRGRLQHRAPQRARSYGTPLSSMATAQQPCGNGDSTSSLQWGAASFSEAAAASRGADVQLASIRVQLPPGLGRDAPLPSAVSQCSTSAPSSPGLDEVQWSQERDWSRKTFSLRQTGLCGGGAASDDGSTAGGWPLCCGGDGQAGGRDGDAALRPPSPQSFNLGGLTSKLPPNCQGWQLVLTGHSLGGAVASLIGLYFRQHYPDLRVACFTYGATPAAMTAEVAEQTREWCTNVVMNKDLLARLNIDSLMRLRDDLVHALAHCRLNKSQLVLRKLFGTGQHCREEDVFLPHEQLAGEAAAMLQEYISSVQADQHRADLAISRRCMPPGRLLFLRPRYDVLAAPRPWWPPRRRRTARAGPLRLQHLRRRMKFDAVLLSDPSPLLKEGILLSRRMWLDHFPDGYLERLRKTAADLAVAAAADVEAAAH